MRKKFQQKNRAFTLVETLIAIAIFTLSLIAVMSVLGSGISDTNYAKQKLTASYLAQEGIEYTINMRDTYVLYPPSGLSWSSFVAKFSSCTSSTPCGFDTSVAESASGAVYPCSANNCKLYVNNGNYNVNGIGVDSGFVSTVWMTTINADQVKVFSNVSWKQGSGTYNILFSENLFNWAE